MNLAILLLLALFIPSMYFLFALMRDPKDPTRWIPKYNNVLLIILSVIVGGFAAGKLLSIILLTSTGA